MSLGMGEAMEMKGCLVLECVPESEHDGVTCQTSEQHMSMVEDGLQPLSQKREHAILHIAAGEERKHGHS